MRGGRTRGGLLRFLPKAGWYLDHGGGVERGCLVEEDLVVDGVPKYSLVRGGKIVEHGFVDEGRIASWRATYAP
jgi:hypothetical protein